jgi:hypothetical protein
MILHIFGSPVKRQVQMILQMPAEPVREGRE